MRPQLCERPFGDKSAPQFTRCSVAPFRMWKLATGHAARPFLFSWSRYRTHTRVSTSFSAPSDTKAQGAVSGWLFIEFSSWMSLSTTATDDVTCHVAFRASTSESSRMLAAASEEKAAAEEKRQWLTS